MELKDAIAVASQIADQIVAYKKKGYTNIQVKQVNDPNPKTQQLQEGLLLDMIKDGEAVEVRLFTNENNNKVVVTANEGKVNKKNA